MASRERIQLLAWTAPSAPSPPRRHNNYAPRKFSDRPLCPRRKKDQIPLSSEEWVVCGSCDRCDYSSASASARGRYRQLRRHRHFSHCAPANENVRAFSYIAQQQYLKIARQVRCAKNPAKINEEKISEILSVRQPHGKSPRTSVASATRPTASTYAPVRRCARCFRAVSCTS